MKKAVKKTGGKYLTERKFGVFQNTFKKFENSFEINMRSIAKSFARVDESLGEINKTLKMQQDVLQIMLKEITAIHEDNKYFRESISSLNKDGLYYDKRIENLDIRVEKLESKAK